MTQARITIGGILVGLVAAVALAAVLFVALGPTAAAPAGGNPAALPAAAASTPPAPTAVEALPATPDAGQHYADLLVQNFAGRLGTDPARLNSAFSAAANDTIDQAVRDGQLTRDEASKAKAQAGQGLGAIFMNGFRTSSTSNGAGPGDQGEMGAAAQAVVPALAPLFGLTDATLADALKRGQSLQSLEHAHNVTPQQVQSAALAAIRSALNAGVPKGQWSQAAADKTYQVFKDNIANFLLKITGGAGPAGADRNNPAAGPQQAAFQSASEAVAGLFGMPFNTLVTALRDGQTTLLALEQAHGVTEQQVHDTALAAAQQALTDGVHAGKWTQADAATAAQDFSAHVYDYLAKFRNAFEMPALIQAAQSAVAALFGQAPADLIAALQGGQTLTALEQAHGVTAQQVRDAALAAGRTRLVTGVQNKEWTQAQADDAALVFNETLDQLVSGNLGAGVKTGSK